MADQELNHAGLIEPSTSASLLAQSLNGRPRAFDRLHELYAPLVFHWARRGLQVEDAFDVCQEVFHALHQKLGQYDPTKQRFRAWLWTITRNQIIDLARRKKRYGDFLEELQDIARSAPVEAVSSNVPGLVASQALGILESELSGKMREVAIATLIDGRTAASVAEDFQTTRAFVYSAKSRALALLRQLLAGLEFID